jgi:opacity protein-like surface antigen
MRKKLGFVGLSLTALASASAMAADLPTSKPAPPPILTTMPNGGWTGLYAGSIAGVGVGMATTRQGHSASASNAGFTDGALIGYNWQTGAFVYGLEGDISANYGKQSFGAAPGLVANTVQNIYALHGRVRLGYDLGWYMPFIAGGVVYGRTEQYQQAPFQFDGDTRSNAGFTIGAGVDFKVSLPILGPSVLRGEYLYDSYPTATYNLNGPVLRTGLSSNTIRFALISGLDTSWKPPASPDVIDWSGDYAGLMGGGAWQSITTTGMGASTKFPASGAIGGVYTGHNWMFGQTMVGLEGATMLANITGHGAQPGAATTEYRDFTESDVRGRVGYAFGRLMPFFAAGVAYGQSQQIDLTKNNNQGLVPSVSWTVGLGADYMLTERFALRAEYLYSRSFTNEDTNLDTSSCCSQRQSNDTLRVGLAYYFH